MVHTGQPGHFLALITLSKPSNTSSSQDSSSKETPTSPDSPTGRVVSSSRTSLSVNDSRASDSVSVLPRKLSATSTSDGVPEQVVNGTTTFTASTRTSFSSNDSRAFGAVSQYPYQPPVKATGIVIAQQTSLKQTLESGEGPLQDDTESVEDVQAAKVRELEDTIVDLKELVAQFEAKADKATRFKEQAQKIGKKKVLQTENQLAQEKEHLEAARSELAWRSAELDAARSENISKDITLHQNQNAFDQMQKGATFASSQYSNLYNQYSMVQSREIAPLQEEVARLTQSTLLQASQIANLQDLLQVQPDVSELELQLSQVCAERDGLKTELEKAKRLLEQTIGELHEAKVLFNGQLVRLYEYGQEHEDFPARGAETDRLIEQKNEEYRLLENKANQVLSDKIEAEKHHQHEMIMQKANFEALQMQADNLAGHLETAREENTRLNAVAAEYFQSVEDSCETGNDLQALPTMYKTLEQTARNSKAQIERQRMQIANVEKELAQERAKVRTRDLDVNEKGTEMGLLRAENSQLKRDIEDLELKMDLRELGHQEQIEAKDEEIQEAKQQSDELREGLRSTSHNAESSEAVGIIESQQRRIQGLQQRVQDLEMENDQRYREQFVYDTHQEAVTRCSHANMEVMQLNWESAQDEIATLKRNNDLLEKGCDPQKFDLARENDQLSKENAMLEQKYQQLEEKLAGHLEGMVETIADAKDKFIDRHERIRRLADLADSLCENLKEAWFGGDCSKPQPKTQVTLEQEQILDAVEARIQEMLEGIPAAQGHSSRDIVRNNDGQDDMNQLAHESVSAEDGLGANRDPSYNLAGCVEDGYNSSDELYEDATPDAKDSIQAEDWAEGSDGAEAGEKSLATAAPASGASSASNNYPAQPGRTFRVKYSPDADDRYILADADLEALIQSLPDRQARSKAVQKKEEPLSIDQMREMESHVPYAAGNAYGPAE
ncbi:MAG: hypothetical protein LQ338_006735 [Usnochroma carphineum]|nr:MAG: hypothetical protein LQ338_006735 [Usnochroma carphineum]